MTCMAAFLLTTCEANKVPANLHETTRKEFFFLFRLVKSSWIVTTGFCLLADRQGRKALGLAAFSAVYAGKQRTVRILSIHDALGVVVRGVLKNHFLPGEARKLEVGLGTPGVLIF